MSMPSVVMLCGTVLVGCAPVMAQPPSTDARNPWPEPLLGPPVQLTFRKDFIKAGEAYFSPDARWVIFQAVEVPAPGSDLRTPDKKAEPSPYYAMYVAKVIRDDSGRITGLGKAELISPPGSANTCGWFHPLEKARVLYGSTTGEPAPAPAPGYQRGTRSYAWSFPPEMEVVTQTVRPMALDYGLKIGVQCGTDFLAAPVFARPGYDAECSYSSDGRFIIYTHAEDERDAAGAPKKPDADIWVYDTQGGGDETAHRPLVIAPGYDGGPFLSPDGKRLCYRSDRQGNDLLQIYVCDLIYADGVPTGITNERSLTANDWVNWAPYWHPSGKFLIFGSSGADHNYDVYAMDVNAAPGSPSADLRKITAAPGADILPVFSPDGKWMMWTSQRAPAAEGEEKSSSQMWVAEWLGGEGAHAK